ncbi:hypothetical protein AGMMS49959_13370 [Planctomycetales bacterium]|nr:hypothetical protein AGMMS49959_13370 [Planctomycetales bacterium]
MRQALIGLLLLAVGFMPVAAQSAESETVEVVATGVGKDSNAAVKNALRAAVEQAVGALVDTETLAKNDELVSDQILTYSAGYVQSHQILGEPKTADGLVTVKIRAVVKRNELRKTLKAASIAQVTEVDGQSLFGEAITKIEQQHSAKEIAVAVVKRAFTGYPLNVMEAKLAGKPKYDEQNKQWIVPVEVSVNQAKYKEFTKGVMAALGQVAISSRQVSLKCGPHKEGGVYFYYNFPQKSISIVTRINEARTLAMCVNYSFDFQDDGSGWKAVQGAVNFTKQNVSVEIVDSDDEVVAAKELGTYGPYYKYGDHSEFIVLCPMRGENSAMYWKFGYKSVTNVVFDISPTEFQRLKNIVVKLNEVK